jgi:hypothetical protein
LNTKIKVKRLSINILIIVRQGSGAPAQYIRLTTAQALAAGILPAVGAHSDGSHQQLQLAGNKVRTKK